MSTAESRELVRRLGDQSKGADRSSVLLYSVCAPDILAQQMRATFKDNRGPLTMPNITGAFTSTYRFHVRPKWTVVFVHPGVAGFAANLEGEVVAHGTGSAVLAEFNSRGALGRYFLVALAVVTVWLIVNYQGLAALLKSGLLLIALVVWLPVSVLFRLGSARRLVKRELMGHFGLTEVEPKVT